MCSSPHVQDWLVSFLREFRNLREYNTFSLRGVFRAHPNDPGGDPGNLVYVESLRVVAPGWLSTGVTNYEKLGDMVEALLYFENACLAKIKTCHAA